MLVRCLAMMRGGGETRHLAWARELTALGVEVAIIAGRPLLRRPRYAVEGVPVTVVRSPYARDFVYRWQTRRGFGRVTMHALHADEEYFCRLAWRHIATHPAPDVVHAHALHQAARLKSLDVPVVINLPGEPNPRYAADLQRADALVADGWAAEHLPAVLGRPVEPVIKGVDAERFRPEGTNHRDALRLTDRRVIVTVARLVPIKNVRLLIEALALVRSRVPQTHLLIVGDGPEASSLRAAAANLNVTDAITFAGSVAHADTAAFYRSGDVFALSSDFDNSPNVVLEAMACGLPVVATNVGGVRQFVSVPEGGVVVAPGDAGALATALQPYLESPATAREAGSHNRRRASSDFSWRASALGLLAIYERLIARRQRIGVPA